MHLQIAQTSVTGNIGKLLSVITTPGYLESGLDLIGYFSFYPARFLQKHFKDIICRTSSPGLACNQPDYYCDGKTSGLVSTIMLTIYVDYIMTIMTIILTIMTIMLTIMSTQLEK